MGFLVLFFMMLGYLIWVFIEIIEDFDVEKF